LPGWVRGAPAASRIAPAGASAHEAKRDRKLSRRPMRAGRDVDALERDAMSLMVHHMAFAAERKILPRQAERGRLLAEAAAARTPAAMAPRTWLALGRLARLVALLAALIMSLSAGSAFARDRLDQQNLDAGNAAFGIGLGDTPFLSQTFTAGVTGKLDRIGVVLEPNTSDKLPTGTVFAEIFPTDANGAPDTVGKPLGSGSVASTAIPGPPGGVTRIRLSKPASVVKGARYAIVLHTDQPISGVFSWFGSTAFPNGDQYARGDAAEHVGADGSWTSMPGEDFFFQTYVAVRRGHHRHRHQ
jgi:hypothetical protein